MLLASSPKPACVGIESAWNAIARNTQPFTLPEISFFTCGPFLPSRRLLFSPYRLCRPRYNTDPLPSRGSSWRSSQGPRPKKSSSEKAGSFSLSELYHDDNWVVWRESSCDSPTLLEVESNGIFLLLLLLSVQPLHCGHFENLVKRFSLNMLCGVYLGERDRDRETHRERWRLCCPYFSEMTLSSWRGAQIQELTPSAVIALLSFRLRALLEWSGCITSGVFS